MARTMGQVIADARAGLSLTQKQLAAKAGLSRSYICDIENDRYTPSVKSLFLLARLLGLDLNFFAIDDGNTSAVVSGEDERRQASGA